VKPSSREQANAAVREFLSRRDWSKQTPARQRILAAFLRLATTNVYGAVSMRTLSGELGLRPSSLYSSFPGGKDEIVAEALSWFTHRFGQDLLATLEGARSAEDYWAALVRFHLSQQLQRPEADLWDLLVATDRVGKFLSEETREEVATWLRLHEAMFAAAAEEMGRSLPSQNIFMILTLLDGAARWASWDGSPDSLEKLLVNAVAVTRSILSTEIPAPTGISQG
jgi:AcrR family transcriptional regulator